jgi:type IV pilus assembly protein PilA
MNKNKKGFTLLEILLAVAALVILAGIVILAINPTKQLADTRNAQRWMDVNTILNAVYQFSIDNTGTLPTGVTASTTEICRTATCAGLADLQVLTASGKYIVNIPSDPKNPVTNTNGASYTITKDGNGRVTVAAPLAENSATITVTR